MEVNVINVDDVEKNLKLLLSMSKYVCYDNLNIDGKKCRKKLAKMIHKVQIGEIDKLMKEGDYEYE